MGRDGRVIELHVLTGREGGRHRGREGVGGVVLRGEDVRGKTAVDRASLVGLLLVSSNKL